MKNVNGKGEREENEGCWGWGEQGSHPGVRLIFLYLCPLSYGRRENQGQTWAFRAGSKGMNFTCTEDPSLCDGTRPYGAGLKHQAGLSTLVL